MKKGILVCSALALTVTGMAQQKYIESALYDLNGKNYDEAKADIDRAEANPETKDKAKTLYVKAQVYNTIKDVEKYKSAATWKDATQALVKLVEVKPDYEKEEVNKMLYNGFILYYNEGVTMYNDKKTTESVEDYKNVVKIHDLKRFEKFPNAKKLDTISASAEAAIAKSFYFAQDYAGAIAQFNKLKSNPAAKSVENYNILLDAYDKYNAANNNKMITEQAAAIQEARKEYPNDANIKTSEINYYISNHKLNELVGKLEEAAAKEPNNADLQMNLAITYMQLAAPKDGKKPADAAQYQAKSEATYLNAVKLAPDNANINSNLGIMYFNEGVEYNQQMADITGVTAADNAKADALQKKRDAAFAKAAPYLDKAYTVLAAKSGKTPEDKETYRSSMLALKQVYAVQNKADKMKEMSEKLKELDASN